MIWPPTASREMGGVLFGLTLFHLITRFDESLARPR